MKNCLPAAWILLNFKNLFFTIPKSLVILDSGNIYCILDKNIILMKGGGVIFQEIIYPAITA